jgi:hypothetical protein
MLKSFLRMAHTNQSTMKYVLVTGGVISGIGKGVIASSIGTLLNSCGIVVTSIKIDPYINIDAGTFSPYEHGKSNRKFDKFLPELYLLLIVCPCDLDTAEPFRQICLGNYFFILQLNLFYVFKIM